MSILVINPFMVQAPSRYFTAPTSGENFNGDTITYNISTSGLGNETLYFTLETYTGTIDNNDFFSPSYVVSNGGSVNIVSNFGTFSLVLSDSAIFDGSSFYVALRTGSTSGPIVATSSIRTLSGNPAGEQLFTTPGVYTWTAPAGVKKICVVAIGGGGGGNLHPVGAGGAGGGGLRWTNFYTVVPGTGYTVSVGTAGQGDTNSTSTSNSTNGGTSYFVSTAILRATGGDKPYTNVSGNQGGGSGGNNSGTAPNSLGQNGGDGGTGYIPTPSGFARLGGGGGAGGYRGKIGAADGNGGTYANSGGQNGSRGGGGGGGAAANSPPLGAESGGGGGVELYGEGSNGLGGDSHPYGGDPGGGGSGGSNASGQDGGLYGGGAGSKRYSSPGQRGGNGGSGAVRIIWGDGRSFPFNAA